MVNDLIKNYSTIFSREPPKVTRVFKYLIKNANIPIDQEIKEETQYYFCSFSFTDGGE